MVDPRSSRTSSQTGGVRSVNRALEILSLLTEQRPSITIREMIDATGLPKTTVLRLVQTLEQSSLLWATGSGYMPGPGLWRWAHLAKNTWEVPPQTRSIIRDLVSRQQETANLYVRRDIYRVCVAQEESPHALRHVVGVGDELPLWAGATSKVLLQGATPQLLERVARASPEGPPHASVLEAQSADAAERGHAISHGEREVGLSAVAVGIPSPNGSIVAALSFSGPTVRFTDERITSLLQDLHDAARRLAEHGFDHPLSTGG